MTEIRFYHLQRARLEEVLPVILERCYQRNERALVLTGSSERAEALGTLLWTYRPDSFLPHATARDGAPEQQPIFIGEESGPEGSSGDNPNGANPNGAAVLVLSDGASHPEIGSFRLVCELFDGHDDAAVAGARERWRHYREAGHSVVYFQQGETGKWQETARA